MVAKKQENYKQYFTHLLVNLTLIIRNFLEGHCPRCRMPRAATEYEYQNKSILASTNTGNCIHNQEFFNI